MFPRSFPGNFIVQSLSAMVICMAPPLGYAQSLPASEQLDFTVLKDGDPIGHHRINVERKGDDTTVSIQTNIVVKVAYVPVYRFEHKGDEVWRNGKLVSLRSTTNDDGDKHSLFVVSQGDHLNIESDGGGSLADVGIIPASLWNPDVAAQSVLLNTLTGKQMQVTVADLGDDTVKAHGGAVKAHHFKVSGDLQREIWYDPTGTLVQVKFKARDNSDILYVLG